MYAISFDDPQPTRILDGTDTTHNDAGTATFRGKEYAFFVRRVHVKRTTPWEMRGVHYWAELRRNGRKVRDDALTELRAEIVEAFKPRVRALAATFEAAPMPTPEPKAAEARSVVLHLTEAQYHVLDQALAARERDLERLASSTPHHVLAAGLPTLRETRQAAGLAITAFWASRRTGWRI